MTQSCTYCHLPFSSPAVSDPPADPVYCCYGCRLAAQITQASGEHGQVNWMVTRLGISIFLTMCVMGFTMYTYGQELHAVDATTSSDAARSLEGVMQYLCLLFALPVFVLLGWPIAVAAGSRGSLSASRTDLLILLGVTATFVYSYVSTLRGSGGTYYETGCMILVLLTLGRYLEASGKLRASRALQSLEDLLPREVKILRGTAAFIIPMDLLRQGDLIIIEQGNTIAADGVVEFGSAHVDERHITGESRHREVSPGDRVHAGSLAVDGSLQVRATAVGDSCMVGRIRFMVDEARRSKGRYERLAERIAAAFVPITIVLALVGAFLGYGRSGLEGAILTFLAVTLIACPCAFGLATPLAVWVAMGQAALRGVLFGKVESLERLAGVRAMAFDKTGTLTTGEPRIDSVITENAVTGRREEVVGRAVSLAAFSSHSLARSVSHQLRPSVAEVFPVADVKTLPGRGIRGLISGDAVWLGSSRMMNEEAFEWPAALSTSVRELESSAASLTCVAWGDRVRGVVSFSEELRPGASATIRALENEGIHVEVLTGDHAARGRAISEELKVPVGAGLLPNDKLDRLHALKAGYGVVAMVGDGINDAPSLAAADVGIAMGCGSELSRESAAVCLIGNELAVLPWLVQLSRKTVRVIRGNFFWAFAYNVLGVGLALVGKLGPSFAAAAMVLSSVFVVGNSLRLTREGASLRS